MKGKGPRHEFNNVLEGVELSSEQVDTLSNAMNAAAANALATVDFHRAGISGAVYADPRVIRPDIITRGGIWTTINREQLEQLGIPGM